MQRFFQHVRHGLSHKRNPFFFCRPFFPHHKKGSLMSQSGFPLFPLPEQHSTVSYGNILNTPMVSRNRVPLHGSGSSDSFASLPGHLRSGSSISPDTSLLSPLYTNTSLTGSSSLSPGSPQAYAYTQLARQYKQCQEELKKVNQEYGRLKYVFIFY